MNFYQANPGPSVQLRKKKNFLPNINEEKYSIMNRLPQAEAQNRTSNETMQPFPSTSAYSGSPENQFVKTWNEDISLDFKPTFPSPDITCRENQRTHIKETVYAKTPELLEHSYARSPHEENDCRKSMAESNLDNIFPLQETKSNINLDNSLLKESSFQAAADSSGRLSENKRTFSFKSEDVKISSDADLLLNFINSTFADYSTTFFNQTKNTNPTQPEDLSGISLDQGNKIKSEVLSEQQKPCNHLQQTASTSYEPSENNFIEDVKISSDADLLLNFINSTFADYSTTFFNQNKQTNPTQPEDLSDISLDQGDKIKSEVLSEQQNPYNHLQQTASTSYEPSEGRPTPGTEVTLLENSQPSTSSGIPKTHLTSNCDVSRTGEEQSNKATLMRNLINSIIEPLSLSPVAHIFEEAKMSTAKIEDGELLLSFYNTLLETMITAQTHNNIQPSSSQVLDKAEDNQNKNESYPKLSPVAHIFEEEKMSTTKIEDGELLMSFYNTLLETMITAQTHNNIQPSSSQVLDKAEDNQSKNESYPKLSPVAHIFEDAKNSAAKIEDGELLISFYNTLLETMITAQTHNNTQPSSSQVLNEAEVNQNKNESYPKTEKMMTAKVLNGRKIKSWKNGIIKRYLNNDNLPPDPVPCSEFQMKTEASKITRGKVQSHTNESRMTPRSRNNVCYHEDSPSVLSTNCERTENKKLSSTGTEKSIGTSPNKMDCTGEGGGKKSFLKNHVESCKETIPNIFLDTGNTTTSSQVVEKIDDPNQNIIRPSEERNLRPNILSALMNFKHDYFIFRRQVMQDFGKRRKKNKKKSRKKSKVERLNTQSINLKVTRFCNGFSSTPSKSNITEYDSCGQWSYQVHQVDKKATK